MRLAAGQHSVRHCSFAADILLFRIVPPSARSDPSTSSFCDLAFSPAGNDRQDARAGQQRRDWLFPAMSAVHFRSGYAQCSAAVASYCCPCSGCWLGSLSAAVVASSKRSCIPASLLRTSSASTSTRALLLSLVHPSRCAYPSVQCRNPHPLPLPSSRRRQPTLYHRFSLSPDFLVLLILLFWKMGCFWYAFSTCSAMLGECTGWCGWG